MCIVKIIKKFFSNKRKTGSVNYKELSEEVADLVEETKTIYKNFYLENEITTTKFTSEEMFLNYKKRIVMMDKISSSIKDVKEIKTLAAPLLITGYKLRMLVEGEFRFVTASKGTTH